MQLLRGSVPCTLPLTWLPGWQGERGDRVIEGAKRQHDSNKRLFERSLEAGNAGDELHISVSDAMWALSHVRNFSISRHQEQTEMTLLFLALYVGLPW